MKTIRQRSQEEEPVGIVISRGSPTPHAPRLVAYMWAVECDERNEREEIKAA